MVQDIFLSGLLGYLLGCLNPSLLIAKFKKKDLRNEGTNNLGATNTFLLLGKWMGAIVLVFDVSKSYLSIRLADMLFPQYAFAGVVAGAFSIIGHMFPFYLRFYGGKGLACLGGVVLGLQWNVFFPILLIGLLLAVITNFTCAVPFSAATLFPIVYGISTESRFCFAVLFIACVCVIIKHFENIGRVRNGTELPFRDFLKDHFCEREISAYENSRQ